MFPRDFMRRLFFSFLVTLGGLACIVLLTSGLDIPLASFLQIAEPGLVILEGIPVEGVPDGMALLPGIALEVGIEEVAPPIEEVPAPEEPPPIEEGDVVEEEGEEEEDIVVEVRIRSVRLLIGLGLTWFTRYWFPEELIFPLAKPFLTLPKAFDSYFVCTQSTEAFPTHVATASIACSYFVFPLITHELWCFLIPSSYGEQRRKYKRFFYLSGSPFSLFLFLTLSRVVPNVWHFPYLMGETSTNSLMIKLEPKIYDHILLTIRISFIPSVCSQVPVLVISLLEPRGLSVSTSTNNRRFLLVFPLLTAALSTPPDLWCQIVARLLLSLLIELAIFVASIVQVREEGWTSGMRETIDKKEE